MGFQLDIFDAQTDTLVCHSSSAQLSISNSHGYQHEAEYFQNALYRAVPNNALIKRNQTRVATPLSAELLFAC